MTNAGQFNADYYQAQDPRKAALYNSRPGAPNESQPQLSQADTTALITSLIQAGVTIDEEIDYWGWEPYTIMADRLRQGILWVFPGLGNVISGEVITIGEFSGPMPAGAIATSLDPAHYPAWPVNTPAPPPPAADPVGINEIGPYYAPATGDAMPVGSTYTDVRGTFKKKAIPNQFAIGNGGMMILWVLQ